MARRLDPPLERSLRRLPRAVAAAALAAAAGAARAESPVTAFPPPGSGADWTALLRKYVDDRGLVAYARWKDDPADRKRLDAFAGRLGEAGGAPGTEQELALLFDAYNAFIVQTVLARYPVDSIRSIPGAFTAETHRFGGRLCSLDAIEHTAVALGGYRAHAAMVCAARSCPPLERRAWSEGDVEARLDARMRAWLARGDLWVFAPEENVVRAPRYLDWYRADFERAGVPRVLAAYAPPRYREWLARGGFRIAFLDYDWRLNDQTPRGRE